MFDSGVFWIFVVLFIVFGPWRRGWRHRRERWGRGRDAAGSTPEPVSQPDRAVRDAQIEQLETRVAELESRLDFAERLLAPRREQVPPVGPG